MDGAKPSVSEDTSLLKAGGADKTVRYSPSETTTVSQPIKPTMSSSDQQARHHQITFIRQKTVANFATVISIARDDSKQKGCMQL